MWGSNLFHVGILVIFFGHFGGLLTPIWVFDIARHTARFKQLMAIMVGGVAGVICFVGLDAAAAPPAVRSAHPPHLLFGDIAILLML